MPETPTVRVCFDISGCWGGGGSSTHTHNHQHHLKPACSVPALQSYGVPESALKCGSLRPDVFEESRADKKNRWSTVPSSPQEHAVSVRRGGFRTLTVHHKMKYSYMWHDFMERMFCTYNLGFSERCWGLLQIAGLLIFEDTGQMNCTFHWVEEENPTFQVWSMNSDGKQWWKCSFASVSTDSAVGSQLITRRLWVWFLPSSLCLCLCFLGTSTLQRTLHHESADNGWTDNLLHRLNHFYYSRSFQS